MRFVASRPTPNTLTPNTPPPRRADVSDEVERPGFGRVRFADDARKPPGFVVDETATADTVTDRSVYTTRTSDGADAALVGRHQFVVDRVPVQQVLVSVVRRHRGLGQRETESGQLRMMMMVMMMAAAAAAAASGRPGEEEMFGGRAVVVLVFDLGGRLVFVD